MLSHRPILYALAGTLGGICVENDGCEIDIISDKENVSDDQRIATFVAIILEPEGTSPKLAFSIKYLDSRLQQTVFDFLKKRHDVSISVSNPNSHWPKAKDSQVDFFLLS